MQRSFFYPRPRGLPPAVAQTTDQLLGRLQAVLETNAPIVAQSLQPGLSDSQISTLESQGGFLLSADLRALYHWHNGMSTNSTIGLLPGQRFLPLDEMVLKRALNRQQLRSATTVQRAAYAAFAGHRKSWLQVLDDGGGDGYFYDPNRTDAEGAFFKHFAEGGDYLWFPSFRNFLAGVIECYETRAVKIAPDARRLDQDSAQTMKIWERLGKSRETGG
jgi:cell wall assembly regulator SMI1